MRVISRQHLITYWASHPDAEAPLKAWYDEAVTATWRTPRDIKDQYRSASFVGHNRVVFDIKGNDHRHRLIVAVAYRFGALYIKFVGTHADDDKVDAATVDME